ncbi:MAG: CAP domain-containing protein [Propionibacteriales bacterium]|nr:CAP domain-containing protein [Propionibacteriales bacterium]
MTSVVNHTFQNELGWLYNIGEIRMRTVKVFNILFLSLVLGVGSMILTASANVAPAIAPAAVSNIVHDTNNQQVNGIFAGINKFRASKGLAAVKYNWRISLIAQGWSDHLGATDTFYHNPNYTRDSRVAGWSNAGEIIAVRWDRSAADLVQQWINSPAHNAIMSDPAMNTIGIGVTFTDGIAAVNPNRYAMYGVVDFFKFDPPLAGTSSNP